MLLDEIISSGGSGRGRVNGQVGRVLPLRDRVVLYEDTMLRRRVC
jgi:hypothetical protein